MCSLLGFRPFARSLARSFPLLSPSLALVPTAYLAHPRHTHTHTHTPSLTPFFPARSFAPSMSLLLSVHGPFALRPCPFCSPSMSLLLSFVLPHPLVPAVCLAHPTTPRLSRTCPFPRPCPLRPSSPFCYSAAVCLALSTTTQLSRSPSPPSRLALLFSIPLILRSRSLSHSSAHPSSLARSFPPFHVFRLTVYQLFGFHCRDSVFACFETCRVLSSNTLSVINQ